MVHLAISECINVEDQATLWVHEFCLNALYVFVLTKTIAYNILYTVYNIKNRACVSMK